jgi:mycothiol synthase
VTSDPPAPPAAAPDVRIEVVGRLDEAELERVALLVERATETDGVRPLSEHATLHLRHGDDVGRNVLLYLDPDRLAGYGHLDVSDAVSGSSAELVVDPQLRGRGLGRLLVQQLVAETPDGRLSLWSHGGLPAAAALARSMGMTSPRALWQMRRSLASALPEPALPPGVLVRTFRPGADDDAWLALNRLAFADHPEQGIWTADDLHRRMAEPWFDPEGFFLAEREGRLVSFHWTKVHGSGPDAVGEVYVVGVDPAEQGHGLGRALTIIGLRHLRAAGLSRAILYVDGANEAAIRVYEGLGFARSTTDVMFSR